MFSRASICSVILLYGISTNALSCGVKCTICPSSVASTMRLVPTSSPLTERVGLPAVSMTKSPDRVREDDRLARPVRVRAAGRSRVAAPEPAKSKAQRMEEPAEALAQRRPRLWQQQGLTQPVTLIFGLQLVD